MIKIQPPMVEVPDGMQCRGCSMLDIGGPNSHREYGDICWVYGEELKSGKCPQCLVACKAAKEGKK